MKSLIVSLILFLSFNLSAQNGWHDVVYLKNGSKIKGMITEFVPNVSYTITTTDGSIFICNIGDILKITKEQTSTPSASSVPPNNYNSPIYNTVNRTYNDSFTKGYRGIVEVGYGLKSGKYGLDVFNFNFVNGYQFTEKLFAGVGTGIKYFNESEMTLIPLYADFKYLFLNQKVSPMLGFSAGFSFNPNNGFEGEGFLFNPSIGTQIKGKHKTRYNISLNYQTQQINFLVLEPGGSFMTNAIRFSESAGITLGLVF